MIIISIIVLSHNRLGDLRVNLPALLADLPPEMELIVVDNASTDGSREFLKELQLRYTNLRIRFLDQNMGPPPGRNAGFRGARGKYIVALDDDTSMSVGDIKQVPELFAIHQQAGILAFCVRDARTGVKFNDYGDSTKRVANFHGAAHAIRAELFARVGYLDELCSFGGEEFDFSVRCHAVGYKTIYLPEVQALHNSFPHPRPIRAERQVKWLYNFIRILHKHFPRRMAYLYSFRYIILNFIWCRDLIDLPFIASMFKAALLGTLHGKMAHAPVPAETVKFYSDPILFPPYGNVPLNLLQRFSRKVTRSWRRRNSLGKSI